MAVITSVVPGHILYHVSSSSIPWVICDAADICGVCMCSYEYVYVYYAFVCVRGYVHMNIKVIISLCNHNTGHKYYIRVDGKIGKIFMYMIMCCIRTLP
jgi:hypothetical protein